MIGWNSHLEFTLPVAESLVGLTTGGAHLDIWTNDSRLIANRQFHDAYSANNDHIFTLS